MTFRASSASSVRLLGVLLFLLSPLAAFPQDTPPASGEFRLAVLTVQAGSSLRIDTPVSADIKDLLDPWQPMRLVEIVSGGRQPVSFQADPVEQGRIWWILSGKTEPGAQRTYELEKGAPTTAATPGVELKLDAANLEITQGGAKVMQYHHGFVQPPDGVNWNFIRSGYINPLYSPKGRILTEDFPKDHLHHKGVWFTYPHTEFEGHPVDFWNLGDKLGTVRFKGFGPLTSGPVFGGYVARHEFLDITQEKEHGGKVAMNDEWDLRVWNVGGAEKGSFLWDLSVTLRCATSSPVKFPEYRYGGIGYRGPKEWNGDSYKVLTSEGKSKLDGHTTRAKWCDHAGAIEGEWSGVTIMGHPKNFRFPESMRIWDKGGCFFCYAPVQLGDSELAPGEDRVSRYRFYIHEGESTANDMNRLWEDFGNPPAVTIQAATK